MQAGVEAEQPTQQTKECPSCHAAMPVHKGYTTWCDACGWNAIPKEPEPKKSKFGKLIDEWYDKMGKSSGRALLDVVVMQGEQKPKWSVSQVGVILLAAVTHLLTLGVAALGVYLLVAGWEGRWGFFWGPFVLAIAWLVRPRFSKPPKGVVSRSEFPALYRLVDDLSEQLGSPKVEGIVIDDEYNAFFTQVGLARKRYMGLGMPLLTALEGQEIVAIVGHELAHGVNGDPNRGWFAGNAIHALMNWYWLIRPPQLIPQRGGLYSYLGIPLRLLVLFVTDVLLRGMIYAIVFLNWRDSQRAEYYADALAMKLSGLDATKGALEKLYLSPVYWDTVQSYILNRRKDSLLDAFELQLSRLPGREVERIRRLMMHHSLRLDATHPPTAFRIQFMESLDNRLPGYKLSEELEKRIRKELDAIKPRMEQKIVETCRDYFYR